jgi:hypothetical protein
MPSYTDSVSFDCPSNQLTALNLTDLTELQTLDCSENRLTGLNVTGLTGLYRALDVFDERGAILYTIPPKLDCSRNYIANESNVIGFTGTWGKDSYIFNPQYTIKPPDGGSGGGGGCNVGGTGILALIALAYWRTFVKKCKR